MSHNTLLDRFFEELCPDFRFENWPTTDSVLSEAAEQFIRDPSSLDDQGQYLAEAICLDGFKPDKVVESMERYLKHYVSRNFGNDTARIDAINRLSRDASTNQASTASQQFAELLSNRLVCDPMSYTKGHMPLQSMKDVQQPTRFGDIVFLPRDAEIIVIGDTHGDLSSTRNIIGEIKTSRALENGVIVVFLGDYVNNGVKSWQNLFEIISFQQTYPDSVVLLSGNHEFRESYLTALNEFLNTHWGRFTSEELPPDLQDRLPRYDNHYGHLRLELVRCFGFIEGERLYSMCADWGMSLPYICISDNLMLSHSLGKLDGHEVRLSELLYGKQRDVDNMKRLGYEIWHARRPSLHSALVNNRAISTELVMEFNHVLNVEKFVVGHCHYRSGDTLHLGNITVSTIVSSGPFSPDSGHYMYQQMMVERINKRQVENLTMGDATAGYLLFSREQGGSRKMSVATMG